MRPAAGGWVPPGLCAWVMVVRVVVGAAPREGARHEGWADGRWCVAGRKAFGR